MEENSTTFDETINISFEKLTPVDNADISIYEDALEFAFTEPDVNNIAITGSYSSGKSSVLETYKKKHNKRFIHISLANFEENGGRMPGPFNRNIDTILEGKIINQLIHQISPDSIPKTHFKIKRDSSPEKVMAITSFIVMLIISSFFTFFPNVWLNFISDVPESYMKSFLVSLVKTPFIYSMWLIAALFVCMIIFSVVKMQFERNVLKKIAVKGLEIEVLEDNKDSYFDKYLNEVLYIFEKAEVDGIVFEDIDRYDSSRIFTKLREISYLVNKKSKSKKLCFLYLLRDDIFISKDRTKFFDLIIPIVPVVDSSNSVDMLLKRFKKVGIIDKFDPYFLEGLSLYIDDLRLLKNICNEYLVYINRIKNIELNSNKLLAIMALKNIFPKEFSELQLGRGYLSSLFLKKEQILEAYTAKLKEELKHCDGQINVAKSESLNNVLELDMLFIEPNSNEYIRHNTDKSFSNRKDKIAYLKKHPEEFTVFRMRTRNVRTVSDTELGDGNRIIEKLEKNTEYKNRKKNILLKSNDKAQQLNEKKKSIENKLQRSSHKKLHELINKDTEKLLFPNINKNEKYEFADILNNEYYPLIIYLVREGYIDETYPDYLSYFYEESIKRVDKIFLRSVLDHTPKQHTYEVLEPKKVIKRLKAGYFHNEELLNNSILDHLLMNWSNKGKNLLRQVTLKENEEFFWQFFLATKHKIILMNKLYDKHFEYFNFLLESKNADPMDIEVLIAEIINTFSQDDIKEMNNHDNISDYIYGNMGLLSNEKVDIDRLIGALTVLGIEYPSVPINDLSTSVEDAIYRNNLYELNIDNVVMWLKRRTGYSQLFDSVDLSKLTSIIYSAPNEELPNYVNHYLSYYLDQIDLVECDKFTDEPEVVLEILNDDDPDYSQKLKFLKRQKNKIEKITDVEDLSMWNEIFTSGLVEVSSYNIVKCYIHNDNHVTPELIEFINNSKERIDITYDEVKDMEGAEFTSAFYKEIIQCNEIINEKYEELLDGFDRRYKSFSFKDIEALKVKTLILNKIIWFTEENLKFIREEYFEVLDYFVAANFDKYIDLVEDSEIESNELYKIIESEYLDDGEKIKFLSLTSEELEVSKRTVSDKVFRHILRNNFSLNDLGYCIEQWPNRNQDVKDDIEIVLSNNIDSVLAGEYDLNPDLVIGIMKKNELDREIKQSLILACLESLNKNQAKELMLLAGEKRMASIFESKRPNIPISEFSESVLSYFRRKGWITSFKTSKEKEGCYKVISRRKWLE